MLASAAIMHKLWDWRSDITDTAFFQICKHKFSNS